MSTLSDTAEKLRELIDKWDGLADDTDASPSDLRRVERAILVIVIVRAPAILTALTAAADVERAKGENEPDGELTTISYVVQALVAGSWYDIDVWSTPEQRDDDVAQHRAADSNGSGVLYRGIVRKVYETVEEPRPTEYRNLTRKDSP